MGRRRRNELDAPVDDPGVRPLLHLLPEVVEQVVVEDHQEHEITRLQLVPYVPLEQLVLDHLTGPGQAEVDDFTLGPARRDQIRKGLALIHSPAPAERVTENVQPGTFARRRNHGSAKAVLVERDRDVEVRAVEAAAHAERAK